MNNKQLGQELRRLNALYRAGTPEISDAEYDALKEQWLQEFPDDPYFSSIEPAPVGQGRKRKLPILMRSLNKVKSLGEIQQWLKALAIPSTAYIVITPKFDGVSWLHDEETGCTYSRGGSENEGQDCTSHYLKGDYGNKDSWNQFYPPRFTFGELVFSRTKWETEFVGKNSDATGEPYRSPRNTIAGFINREDASDLIRHADFYRYGIGDSELSSYDTYTELYDTLCRVYAQPNLKLTIHVSELSEALLANLFKEWRTQYYIDGLVIYIDSLRLWENIGRQQTTGNPLYAMAYKHPDFTDVFETKVKGIDWKVSKAGALKPVINIETVDTGDCLMENPTGYNAKYVFENGIGKDAIISVTRSGGVIPKIISVLKEATDKTMCKQRDDLLYCPDCGQPTQWNDSKVELICTNPDCPGIRLAKIVHFYNTLGAEQMGEETLAKLFRAGYNTLRRILDITFEEIMLIDGFGDAIANVILDVNHRIRDGVEVTKLMHASDCFNAIGQVKAKTILSGLSDGDRFAFLNGCVQTEEGFDRTPQFLSLNKTMQSFLKGIVPFYDFIAKNKLKILPMEEKPKTVGDKYSGMKVCFTGIRDKELEDTIVSQGGEVVNGITKKTTHLIVADLNTTSSKASKAKALGVPIFTVEDFKAL